MPEANKSDASLMKILKDSGRVLKSSVLPAILVILFASLFVGVISMLFLPDLAWQVQQLNPEIEIINNWVDAHPGEQLPDAMYQTQREYTLAAMTHLILQSSFIFYPLVGLLVFLPGRIYKLHTHNSDGAKDWLESAKLPFRASNQAYTTIFAFLVFPFILSVGILMLYVPGFLFMVYCFFTFQAITLDEKSGREAFRGGAFYAKGNAGKLIVLLFLGVFVPMLITLNFADPLMGALGFNPEKITRWMNPENRNYGALFVYYTLNCFVQNLMYFWFPCLHTVAFDQLRLEKIRQMNLEELQSSNKSEKKVENVVVLRGQKYYMCKKCGKKIPISAKKCSRCGKLYNVKMRKRKTT